MAAADKDLPSGPGGGNSGLRPGFMVLHGNRMEDLRALLTGFLRAHPLAPLQAEVVLVQSNGMKHWLEIALAGDEGLGICAATRMELPGTYLWEVYRAVLGPEAVPRSLPFDKEHLVWRLVRLLPALAGGDAVYAPLAGYLGAGKDGRRLYQLAQQIADVFDGYQSYRADWLADWAEGRDLLRGQEARSAPLPAEQAWQARLWRDLRADLGPVLADASRAGVHARCMRRLEAMAAAVEAGAPRPAGLPPRIVVFGISSLPLQTVEALALLGRLGQVLMLVQNPCRHFWGDIVEGHAQLRQQVRRRQARRAPAGQGEGAGAVPAHPLLASWGKQGRDYLHLLDDVDRVEDYQARLARVEVFVDPLDVGPATQLAQLQSAILRLQPLPPRPLPLPAADDSIRFATAHSAQREVEVLHDRLLDWFEAEPTLQPRDVMVMVPDMERFAPHIHAVFGRFARGTPRHVPYAVADSTARQSPLVQALEKLLSLPSLRVSLTDWLALFEVSAVRMRFGLTPSDVAQLHDWLAGAGVRWGLDASHRRAWGLPEQVPDLDQNTWAFGLRRLLLGYAVGAGAPWGGTLPHPGVRGLDAGLVGRLLEWLDAMQQTLEALTAEHAPDTWCAVLGALVGQFFEAGDDAEVRALERMLDPLERWQQSCAEAGLTTPLPLAVVREHWLAQLGDSGLHQRFFGGGVQFGTLMPMRAIPFQAVCMLGMNDGDYPRQSAPRDFDLMALSWRAGDRSRREDDRYLFLEAILSARSRLYISWQGLRATDNAAQPPSVLVAQLIDHLQAGWTPPRAVQQQPLQPYSESYFLQGSGFETFDSDWARVHAGAAGLPAPDTGAPAAPLPAALTLGDLRQLVRQPVEVFFRARLRVRFPELEDAEQDLEPFELAGLDRHHVGQALLQADEPEAALARMRLSGSLPMAAFGAREVTQLARELQVLLVRRMPWRTDYPHDSAALSVDLALAGMPLSGSLQGLWSAAPSDDPGVPRLQVVQRMGAVLEGTRGARTARGHIVSGLWVNHLAACAGGVPLTSVLLGLDGAAALDPVPRAQALELLEALVLAWRAAWLRPLPVACRTAWAWLQAGARDKDGHEAAQLAFEGGSHVHGERPGSPYLARAFAGYEDIEAELAPWAQAIYAPLADRVRLLAAQEDAA